MDLIRNPHLSTINNSQFSNFQFGPSNDKSWNQNCYRATCIGREHLKVILINSYYPHELFIG